MEVGHPVQELWHVIESTEVSKNYYAKKYSKHDTVQHFLAQN